MRKRKAKQGEKIYILKATLSDWDGRVRGMPYRTLAIPERSTLYHLAEAILDSFNFYFDHAFGFYDKIKKWTESEEGYELFEDMEEESRFKSVERTKVNEAFDKVKKKMLLLFDYGDMWHFIIKLEDIESPKENAKYPQIMVSIGEAPPQYGEIDEEDY